MEDSSNVTSSACSSVVRMEWSSLLFDELLVPPPLLPPPPPPFPTCEELEDLRLEDPESDLPMRCSIGVPDRAKTASAGDAVGSGDMTSLGVSVLFPLVDLAGV